MASTTFVTIAVFGLFHPTQLVVEAWPPGHIRIECGGGSTRTIEGRAQVSLTVGCEVSKSDFLLSVPGRIRRHYRGSLHVFGDSQGELIPVVTMDLETAVASATAAEAPPEAGAVMWQVQAILSRSFYLAQPANRHPYSAFCDTTHCQFLKDPPAAGSPASQATASTGGQTVTFNGRVVPTYYASRCNNQLEPLPPGSYEPGGYPYFKVDCDFCRRNPSNQPPHANARPHHHGLCQFGAQDLAVKGLSVTEILSHYFPGTAIKALP